MDVLYHIPREGECHFVQCSNADDAILRVRALAGCRFNRQTLKSVFALAVLWRTDRESNAPHE
ncbi:hypothetical protein NXC12_CH04234 [Rhizobium etli]|uniref:Uncharacterized protein n=1 Tax=Rhizobium etli TaxID=29449 RepID=A0AAN1BKJ0_RHIET|nr:hypothetical protein NXC12_CH04234 [Rhizobium etli]